MRAHSQNCHAHTIAPNLGDDSRALDAARSELAQLSRHNEAVGRSEEARMPALVAVYVAEFGRVARCGRTLSLDARSRAYLH